MAHKWINGSFFTIHYNKIKNLSKPSILHPYLSGLYGPQTMWFRAGLAQLGQIDTST